MAARRIAQSAINWAAIAERVPPHQKAQYQAFKAKSDNYLRKMLAYPENPPAIDWSMYKNKVPIAGLVDEFQKQYSALKVPYPADTKKSELEAQESEIKEEIRKFKQESEARVAGYQKELNHLNSLIPYDQMTMEDFAEAHPDIALDPLNKPTFWPHDPEDEKLAQEAANQPDHH